MTNLPQAGEHTKLPGDTRSETMNAEQKQSIANLSSGTIAHITGLAKYVEQDEFIAWLFVEGDVIVFGENALCACANAAKAWRRRKIGYRALGVICTAGRVARVLPSS